MKYAIIIPAYNEDPTIGEVVRVFHKALPEAFLCVIDNNSSDSTMISAKKAIKDCKCKGTVLFEKRQGKANAMRYAFSKIDAEIYIVVDADLTYSPSDLDRLIEPVIKGKADITVGNRHAGGVYTKQNKRNFHDFGNRLVKNLINLMFGSQLNDIMSGYRVMTRKFVKNFPVMSEGFEIETEMTLHALDKRFRICEVPISYGERPEGSFSKLKTINDGIGVIKTIFLIAKDFKPLPFYGFLAFVILLAGFAAGIPVIVEFVRYKYIYKVPSAILATGLMIFGMLILMVGLVLDTIAKNHKFIYELFLNRYDKNDTTISS